MPRFYCTYFDRNYLARALALIESLRIHEDRPFQLLAVCLDEVSRVVVEKLALPNVVSVPLHRIEKDDLRLLQVRPNRTLVEYYWTLTPTIILWILDHFEKVDVLTYLDADLYFFSGPEPVFQELGNNDVLIHEHRFAPSLSHLEKESGKYNVGLLCFRNNEQGRTVLGWWRERCLEWCFRRFENGKMGDQMYLNDWVTRFNNVSVLQNVGAGVAPWNHEQYSFTTRGLNQVKVNGIPLVFYHFQSLGIIRPGIFIPAKHTTYPLTEASLRLCYLPYLESLDRAYASARSILQDFAFGLEGEKIHTRDHTVVAKKELRNSLRRIEIIRQPWAINEAWDCYASGQLHQAGAPRSVPVLDHEGVLPLTQEPRSIIKAPAKSGERNRWAEEEDGSGGNSGNSTQRSYLDGFRQFERGEWDAALVCFDQVLENEPRKQGVNFMRGRCFWNLRRLEEAEQAVRSELVIKPDHPDARRLLSEIHARREEQRADNCSSATDSAGVNFKVSAIVSTYNSEKFIRGCLSDLVSQTLYRKGELEVVVIESGSEQREGTIVREFQSRYPHIQHIRVEQRETIYAAWNRGIAAAKGRFITNANADDRHRADALQRMVHVLESRPDIALAYADCAVTEKENETFESARPVAHFRWPEFDRTRLFEVCYVGPQPMWRRDLHERYGYFDPEFRSAGDYEFWLRIVGQEQFLHIVDVLGLYLLSQTGVERGDNSLSFQESEIARDRHWPKIWGKRPPSKGCFLVPTTRTPPLPLDKGSQPLHATAGEKGSRPIVSVVVPTYDRPEKLVEALKSILNQTYQNFEVVVVNDCGADVGSLISFLDQNRQMTYVRHNRNRDRSATRNTGIRLARGKYIAYLDDDDLFYPEHLETLVNFLETTGYKVAYSDAWRTHQVRENGRDINKEKDQPYSRDFDYDQILVNNFIPTLCLMHERSCVDEIGMFDEELATHEDWDLWIRLSRRYRFGHIKKLTCEFSWRTDGTSTTSQRQSDFLRTQQIIYERYRDYAKDKPHIIQAQELNRKILQDRVSREGNVSAVTVSKARTPMDQTIRIRTVSTGNSQPEVSRVMERVNRYVSLGKVDLARKIVHKELGHLKECSEILLALGRRDNFTVAS